jgi:hypothetical protein
MLVACLVGVLLGKMEKTLFLDYTILVRIFEEKNDEGEVEEMLSAMFTDHFLCTCCTYCRYSSCQDHLK